jgi:hypothetical protein
MEVTPSPTPKTDISVMKLRNREFFFDFRYLKPTQLVQALVAR